jgi:DNA-binding transcriptional LysR family regulator
MVINNLSGGNTKMMLRQMKYFVAVVRNNSFTEAAEECYISQSAISQQIQSLEAELGVQLLIRDNRKFTLTHAGEYFYNEAIKLLDQAEKLRQDTIKIGTSNLQQIRIGYPKSYGGYEIHKAVASFSERYPETQLKIINGTHEELYDALRYGEVDIVFNDHRRMFSDLYVNYPIYIAYMYAEISGKNKLAAKDFVTIEELKNIPCLLISSVQQQRNEADYYRDTIGFGGTFLFTENLEEARVLVSANRGFLPIEQMPDLPQVGSTIRRLPILKNGKQIMRDYGAFWKKERDSIYMRAFAELLRGSFGETTPVTINDDGTIKCN